MLRARYRGSELHYKGDVGGWAGPQLDVVPFGSDEQGTPGFIDPPLVFTFEPGKTKLNPALDAAIAGMNRGERRVLIVPAALAFGRSGFYAPPIPGKPRLVIPPYAMQVYEVEVLDDK